MSGTSLDGLDLAWCCFQQHSSGWRGEILLAETLSYTDEWVTRLRSAPELSAKDLAALHYDYGRYTGELVKDFIARNNIKEPGIIASHGHTVFHRPDLGYTLQIGSGAALAAQTGCTVVCDFRSLDVSLQGQGAPLVPIGDQYLFADYQYCLNLGGFANISFEENNTRVAFDICPVNFVLNKLIREGNIAAIDYLQHLPADYPPQEPLKYDPSGVIASTGTINQQLLEQLNSIAFYHTPGPKSLGEEWVNEVFLPLIINSNLSLPHLLRTLYEHMAHQIARCTRRLPGETMLITGGGAFNKFLISLIRQKLAPETAVVIPQQELINFKEALVFGFLGVLRVEELPNTLSSVTGSLYNNIGGCVYLGGQKKTT